MNIERQVSTRLHLPGRREVLCAGGLSLFGLSLNQLLSARAADDIKAANENDLQPEHRSSFGKAKSCIMLFMWGGPAQHDTWDMKPDAPSEVRGEFQPISTSLPGVQICEHFPLLARRVDQLAIIRSMTHDNADHLAATHFLLTGQPPPRSMSKSDQWPNIGAVLAKLGRSRGGLPPFVSMRPTVPGDVPRFVEESAGQWGGWLGNLADPFIIDQDPNRDDYTVGELELKAELSLSRIQDRVTLEQELQRQFDSQLAVYDTWDENGRRAFDLLSAAAHQRSAFDLEQEPQEVRERYGLNPHGQSVLQARRLIERGVPLVTVFWPNDGVKNVSVYWDTHSKNFIDLRQRLMPVADRAFSALLDDLNDRGLIDETLVVWTGEFGRTPKVGQRNSDAGAGRDGRDHWPNCFTSVLAGAGVKKGIVYGRSDKHAAFPADSPVAPADLVATVYHALGVGEDQVLLDLNRRPQFVRPGKAIRELLT